MAWRRGRRPRRRADEPAGGQERAKHHRAPGCLPLHQRGGGQRGREQGSNAIRFRFCAIYHRGEALSGPAFSAHSWLYCRRNIGYQAALKCHAPAVFHGERAGLKRRPFGWAPRPRAVRGKRTNCNGLSDRIGPAAGPGADRRFRRRRIAGSGHGRGDARARAAAAGQAGRRNRRPRNRRRNRSHSSRRSRRSSSNRPAPISSRSSCIRRG